MTTTAHITAGDLITADFINQILDRLAAVEGSAGTGTGGAITVPSVFGFTLASARTLLNAPTTQLSLGIAVGTDGVAVDPTIPANATRLVLFQMPPAGTHVSPGTQVNLVVVAGTSAPPQQAPVIGSITPPTAPANSSVSIIGGNFAPLFSDNIVTFDGVPGTVLSSAASVAHLDVVVPIGIPGIPKNGVNVVVKAGTLSSAPSLINVTAAAPNQPAISPATPASATQGQPFTITGTNFGATPALNRVTFDGIAASTPSSATPTSITVTVPAGVVQVAPKFDVKLVVRNLTTSLDSIPFTLIVSP